MNRSGRGSTPRGRGTSRPGGSRARTRSRGGSAGRCSSDRRARSPSPPPCLMWPGMSTRKNSSGDSETVVTRSALRKNRSPRGKIERLLPDRAGRGRGADRRRSSDSAAGRARSRRPTADRGGQSLRLGADLRPLDVPLGEVAVDQVAELVLPLGDRLVRRGRLEQEIDDAQAEAEVAGPGRLSRNDPAATPETYPSVATARGSGRSRSGSGRRADRCGPRGASGLRRARWSPSRTARGRVVGHGEAPGGTRRGRTGDLADLGTRPDRNGASARLDSEGGSDRMGGRARAGTGGPGSRSAMIVGVPKEIKADEYRVAMLPVGAEELTRAGHTVLIEAGAGQGSGIADAQYAAAGADDRRRRGRDLGAGRPDRQGQGAAAGGVAAAPARADRLHLLPLRRRRGADPGHASTAGSRPSPTRRSATRRGNLPLLTPMSEVAGRMSIQEGAKYLERPQEGPGHPARRACPGVAAGRGRDPRRRHRRRERRQGRRRARGQRPHPRHQPRPAPLPRRHHAARTSRRSIPTGTRSCESIERADLVIGAVLITGARAPRLVRREDLDADEARRGDRRRRHRPGRLRRDQPADDAPPARPTSSTASSTTA